MGNKMVIIRKKKKGDKNGWSKDRWQVA
jgi:hypothetical protein